MDAITFTCPSCERTMRTTNLKLAGKRIKCPKCGEPCPIPRLEEEEEEAPPRTKRTAPKRAAREAPPPLREEVPRRPRRRPERDEEDEDDEDIGDRRRSRKPERKALPVSPIICLAAGVYLLLAILTLVGVFGKAPEIVVAPGGPNQQNNPPPFQPGPNQQRPPIQPNQPNQPNVDPQGKGNAPVPTGPKFAVKSVGVYKTTNVKSLVFSNKKSTLMWADEIKNRNMIVQSWNPETQSFGEPVQIDTIPFFTGAFVSPDAQQLILPNPRPDGIEHWSLTTRKKLPTLARNPKGMLRHMTGSPSMIFTDDGKHLAAIFEFANQQFQIVGYEYRIWDIGTSKTLHAKEYKDDTRGFAISPDAGSIALSLQSENATPPFWIAVWKSGTTAGSKIPLTNQDYAPTGLQFTNDGRTLLATVAGTVYLYDAATGSKKAELQTPQPIQTTESVVISADGKTVAASRGGENDIIVWDVASKGISASLTGHTDMIHNLAISSDGRFVASCSRDKTVRIWELTRQ